MSRAELAIGYRRVSTEEQAESGLGLEYQEEKIRLYCQMKELNLRQIFSDEGWPGTRKDRPAFLEAQSLIRTGMIRWLVALKLDRLARSLPMLIALRDLCKDYSCGLVLISESIQTDTVSGRLVFNIFGSISEWEVENTRERTLQAISRKHARGEYTGGGLPWGYTLDPDGRTLLKDAQEQRLLLRVRRLRLQGHVPAGIATILAAEGFRNRKGNVIHRRQVARMLQQKITSSDTSDSYS